jgi:MFS family permease
MDEPIPLGPSPPAEPAPRAPLWTRTYFLICWVTGLGYAHQAILAPTIPLYVHSIGGSEFVVGLVLAAFSVTSCLLRPLVGYWTDRWSASGIAAAGNAVLGLCGMALMVPTLWMQCVVSGIRGLGWAGLNTGGNTLLAVIAPPARRAEASSYFTLFQSAAHTIFPPMALWILAATNSDYAIVFVLSGLLAMAGAVVAELIRRPGRAMDAPSAEPGHTAALSLAGLYDRGVLLATVLLTCMTTSHPAATAFLPLYGLHLNIGMDGIAWYFIVAGVVGLLARIVLGKPMDRIGRGPSIVVGFMVSMLGLLLFMLAGNLPGLLLGGAFYQLGYAINSSVMLALAIDLADPRRRGAAMATFSLAFPGGVGLGSALGGLLVDVSGWDAMYIGAILVLVVGLAIVAGNWRTIAEPHASAA